MIRTLVSYIIFFVLVIFLTTWRNLLIFKDRGSYLKRLLYQDEIKSGDLFLVGYKKPGNILGDSLLKVNFNHIAVSVWEDSNLYMIEYANYFNKEQGLLKIPYERWKRYNKNTTVLKNKIDFEEDQLANNILKFYNEHKEKLKTFQGGWKPDWYRFLYKKNKYDDAIKILESIDVSNDYRKYFLLGTIYISLKKIDLAENNLTLANKINPNNSSILHNLGTLMATKGNFEIAKNFYLKAININKNIESMSEIGRLYQDEKNFDEAQKYFEMALKQDTNHKTTNLRIGNMYLKMNEYKKGLDHIKKATGFIRFSDEGFEII